MSVSVCGCVCFKTWSTESNIGFVRTECCVCVYVCVCVCVSVCVCVCVASLGVWNPILVLRRLNDVCVCVCMCACACITGQSMRKLNWCQWMISTEMLLKMFPDL